MLNLCVFASGSGSNFIELNKFAKSNSKIKLCLLVSNNPNCGAVKYAKKNRIDVKIINSLRYPNYDNYILEMLKSLKEKDIDFIALAGFLKRIPSKIIEKYYRKILNIHPSLLPAFGGFGYYGMNIHRAVIKSGVNKTGVTIHFVDKEYDKGPIVYQEEVPVLKGENEACLASRVLEVEHRVYKKVINLLINNKIKWIGDNPLVKEI